MATRRPLVNNSGQVQEIPSGDFVSSAALGSGVADSTTVLFGDNVYRSPSAGSTDIKQTEVDFGATPVASGSFVITDAGVSGSSFLIAQQSYDAPTDKDQDENEMDSLTIVCLAGSGQFTMYITTNDGSYLHDKFKINYLIG